MLLHHFISIIIFIYISCFSSYDKFDICTIDYNCRDCGVAVPMQRCLLVVHGCWGSKIVLGLWVLSCLGMSTRDWR